MGVDGQILSASGARERESPLSTPADRLSSMMARDEARLRRALVAAFGPTLGADAAAEAWAWAWEHLDRLEEMDNPAGYLFRVGQSSARRQLRRRGREVSLGWGELLDDRGRVDRLAYAGMEPSLLRSLGTLSRRQRAAVVLVKAHGYHHREAAEVLGCSVSALQTHLQRGMRRLRDEMGVDDD
jgi:RNA polymerase sigma-70 factor (ECF subfamily)